MNISSSVLLGQNCKISVKELLITNSIEVNESNLHRFWKSIYLKFGTSDLIWVRFKTWIETHSECANSQGVNRYKSLADKNPSMCAWTLIKIESSFNLF